MGRAIISGLRDREDDRKSLQIAAYDTRADLRAEIGAWGEVVEPTNWFTEENLPDVILIAVKPQDLSSALSVFQTASASRRHHPLWISIAAGVGIDIISSILGKGVRVCRVMPNTPALIGEGVSAYALNELCTEKDAETARYVLESCGTAVAVPEKDLDAVTGLSGSGPAYVFLFIEALIEGGVTAGLPYDVARQCAVKTVIGAARLVDTSRESPAVLKSRVLSPGGTTAAGLLALEKAGVRHGVITAVGDAAARSEELGSK
jgi:pyrroline-5-carboxylate reductase